MYIKSSCTSSNCSLILSGVAPKDRAKCVRGGATGTKQCAQGTHWLTSGKKQLFIYDCIDSDRPYRWIDFLALRSDCAVTMHYARLCVTAHCYARSMCTLVQCPRELRAVYKVYFFLNKKLSVSDLIFLIIDKIKYLFRI